jgi:hypothetical protein
MGFRTIRTSDLTGAVLEDAQVVSVVVRQHPDLEEAKVFDASAEELKGLKTVDNLVSIELKMPDGSVQEANCTVEDFNALVPKKVLDAASGTRGRRKGFSPNGG